MTKEPGRDADCLFCRIVGGEVPAERVHETGSVIAFRDVAPTAPTHVLVVPKRHVGDVVGLGALAPQDLVDLVAVVGVVASQEGLQRGYRIVLNTGAQAQQSVPHVHAHVIGGRDLTWPPG